jgi:hypothetical protein
VHSDLVAVLHLNALRQAYTTHVGDDYSNVPLVDNAGNPADWLRILLDRSGPALKMDGRQFAGVVLEGIQQWFDAALDQGMGLEAKLAEKFFAVYAQINSDEPLPPLFETRRFDPDRVPTGGPTQMHVLLPEAFDRYSYGDGPFREPMDVSFDDRFDIVDWYVRRFRRPAGAATAAQLYMALEAMSREPLLVMGWDRFPPGVPGPSDVDRRALRMVVDTWMSKLRSPLTEDDFVICWLELNRRDACRVLADIRSGSPREQAIAMRDIHASRAFRGLNEALGFIADVRPDVYRLLAPTIVAYHADLFARQTLWYRLKADADFWIALQESNDMENDCYAPPSQLGREPTAYWEGRPYMWRPNFYGPGEEPGPAAEESMRKRTQRNWTEMCRLRALEVRDSGSGLS